MFILLSAISDGIDWSYGVKLILIVAAAVLLCVVAVLLVAEIVGKRKRRVVHSDAQPQVIEKIVEVPVEVPVEVSEPKPEPEPIVEQVVEEVAAAQVVEEYKLDEEIQLEEDAVLIDDDDEAGHILVGSTQFKVRYNRSFTAKLIQSDDVLKARYSELKNELMRYTLKPRMSWSCESHYKGRVTYAKFAIRGKTLSLYLSLNPSEYVDTKYKFEDCGEVVKYAKTPMRLKLRSNRSVRWAKELIAQLAEKCSLVKIEKQEENFCPEYEETTPLVNRKLIKLYYAGERVYSVPQTQPVAQPVVEVVEEQIVEEIVPEVIEEIAITQPEPEPVEHSAEEICEQPEQAEEPQLTETPYRHRTKNKPRGVSCRIISTGKLNASFEDGEEITLEKLIKKHIFPKYVIYYKVLFGGEVTKSFTVCANEFSSEAKEVIEKAGGTIVKI